MKNKKIFFFICLIFSPVIFKAQEVKIFDQSNIEHNKLFVSKSLSKQDSIKLSSMPEIKIPEKYKGVNAPKLPYKLNNAEKPYFRPIFAQTDWACGQSSGVAYNFCYEINYIRNLPANIPENQYPTHFTYNFLHGEWGASYFESWNIIKANGTPNVSDYGGMNYGGKDRWLSGYDKWYNGMHNRLSNFYSIKVGTPEGLNNLKHWLHDHLDGAETGGVACFWSDFVQPVYLPQGTPEAGKHVNITWGPYSGHSMTIVGYHDSIRYDYNNDGKYTNNIDINNDGIIDMKDWEIGGLLYADANGTNFADNGFCYMMYKTLAEEKLDGGIWNKAVHVVRAKQNYSPLLTMKIILKHTSRQKIKITAGISLDTSHTEPTYTQNFPIFDFQGGDLYMQGGNTEEDKTIEFGLDISSLLSKVNSGEFAKFFLRVFENDPENVSDGEVIHYSIIDYTDGINEIICLDSNIPIINDSVTSLTINYIIEFDDINIETEQLPQATVNQQYNYQLNASGGTLPYQWGIKLDYSENNNNTNFPQINSEQLFFNNNDDGFITKKLDFLFPFYGNLYDSVVIHVDGYLMFDGQIYKWPYNIDQMLLFVNNRSIAPYMCDYKIYPEQGDGIWYAGDDNSAGFRWKVSLKNAPNTSNLEFTAKLYESGEIEFYYGDITLNCNKYWVSGISNGDELNYQISSISNSFNISYGLMLKFVPVDFPIGMEISEDGIFSGKPIHEFQGNIITFFVTDNNNISDTRSIPFTIEPQGIINNNIKKYNITLQNFPNPFQKETIIKFSIIEEIYVNLYVYNIYGKKIKTLLLNKKLIKGDYSIAWNGNNNKVESGIYFCILQTKKTSVINKMIVIK
ncbi:MAG: T9SS type A sorting domain-containing protein [Bacteroidales bacterium]|nr:T9SS type A sorting domain-containing protein [Bacteroidales bacterium]